MQLVEFATADILAEDDEPALAGLELPAGHRLGREGQLASSTSRLGDGMQLERLCKPRSDEHFPSDRMPGSEDRGPEFQIAGGIALEADRDGRNPLNHQIVGNLSKNSGTHAGKTDGAQTAEHGWSPTHVTSFATGISV